MSQYAQHTSLVIGTVQLVVDLLTNRNEQEAVNSTNATGSIGLTLEEQGICYEGSGHNFRGTNFSRYAPRTDEIGG